MARVGNSVNHLTQALCPVMVSPHHRHVPRAPLPINRRYLLWCSVFSATSEDVTPPSLLVRAHAPDQIPPAVFDLTITTGLCRLSSVPAGKWSFPTLSLQSLRRCLDPYPAVSSWCTCSLLPRGQRPHLRRHRFGTPKIFPAMQLQQGIYSRGCSHFIMFRLPRSLDPQVAPTAEA